MKFTMKQIKNILSISGDIFKYFIRKNRPFLTEHFFIYVEILFFSRGISLTFYNEMTTFFDRIFFFIFGGIYIFSGELF